MGEKEQLEICGFIRRHCEYQFNKSETNIESCLESLYLIQEVVTKMINDLNTKRNHK